MTSSTSKNFAFRIVVYFKRSSLFTSKNLMHQNPSNFEAKTSFVLVQPRSNNFLPFLALQLDHFLAGLGLDLGRSLCKKKLLPLNFSFS